MSLPVETGAGSAALIDLASARAHLRLEDDYSSEQLQVYIDAATSASVEFLNRRVYADQGALDEAIRAVPAGLAQAVTDHSTAIASADLVDDLESRCAARDYANTVLSQARVAALEIRRGMVLNAQVEAAMLLTLGDLFENRSDAPAATLPTASQRLLQPFRIGLGV